MGHSFLEQSRNRKEKEGKRKEMTGLNINQGEVKKKIK